MKQTFTTPLHSTMPLLAGLALISGVLQWLLTFSTANSTVLPAVCVMLVLALLPALALFGLFFYTPPFLKNILLQLQRPSGNKASLPLFSLVLGGILFFSTTAQSQNDLGASRVLYYTLETSDFTDTKKMVVLQK